MFKMGVYVNVNLTQPNVLLTSATQKNEFMRTMSIISDKEAIIQIGITVIK